MKFILGWPYSDTPFYPDISKLHPVVFSEPAWTPGREIQVVDRLHRKEEGGS